MPENKTDLVPALEELTIQQTNGPHTASAPARPRLSPCAECKPCAGSSRQAAEGLTDSLSSLLICNFSGSED